MKSKQHKIQAKKLQRKQKNTDKEDGWFGNLLFVDLYEI
jgi:hypothetical protein